MTKEEILEYFSTFSFELGGIGHWLAPETDPAVFARLSRIEIEPLNRVQLNQLLVFGHEGAVTQGFFEYYWLQTPRHTYPVRDLPDFDETWIGTSVIVSLAHLRWGLYRLYVDGLLYFGNVRTAFRYLREMELDQLSEFFESRRLDCELLYSRGRPLALNSIPQDDRYLISEQACKSYGEIKDTAKQLTALLRDCYARATSGGRSALTFRELISEASLGPGNTGRQEELAFSLVEVLDIPVHSEVELEQKVTSLAEKFVSARSKALENTKRYLSMAGDLDIYVATSMRARDDFRSMARFCEAVFNDPKLEKLNIRYFDPTLSAANGHEDKGLVECLMVKCSKALIYCAGSGDSYGKDAEATMALSLGKPVVFYCDQERRRRIFGDVHPLSRLIAFDSGVAVGAMVACTPVDVVELLHRIFTNCMQYELVKEESGYLRLVEKLTQSTVRLQTSDVFLAEAFWNQYHGTRKGPWNTR